MKDRHLYIPFGNRKKIGGPITFLKNLVGYLDKVGYQYSDRMSKSAGIFFPISYPLGQLKIARALGKRIIQRLDGVYYPSQHGSEYKVYNRQIEEIYKKYTDFVVFQSEYSKKLCYEIMGPIAEEKSCIIINGADTSIFYPKSNIVETNKKKFRFICVGNFRKEVMLRPTVEALDSLRPDYDISLTVFGPLKEKSLEQYLERDYITNMQSHERKDIAEALNSHDILIHSQLNDHCPNTVLEAVSCGVPVISFDSGAMAELLPFASDLLAEVNHNLIHTEVEFKSNNLAAKIKLVMDSYEHFKTIALDNLHMYPFEKCGDAYIDVFEMQKKIYKDNIGKQSFYKKLFL